MKNKYIGVVTVYPLGGLTLGGGPGPHRSLWQLDVPGLVLRRLGDGSDWGAGRGNTGLLRGLPQGLGQVRPGQLPHQLLLETRAQLADLPAGGGEVRLQLQLPLPQVLHLPLGRHILSQQLQLLNLEPGYLALQPFQLAGHYATFYCDHRDMAGDHLLALGVKGDALLQTLWLWRWDGGLWRVLGRDVDVALGPCCTVLCVWVVVYAVIGVVVDVVVVVLVHLGFHDVPDLVHLKAVQTAFIACVQP